MRTILLVLLEKNISRFANDRNVCCDMHWQKLVNSIKRNCRDLDNVFNWTMNYMRDSDIYHPYGFYLPLNHSELSPPTSINHAKGKSRLAVWTCSGHGQIVRQLRKHIPIDVYGKSAIYFHQTSLKVSCIKDKAYGTADCRSHLQNYKFFIAFENMNCEDYITEKY